MSASADAGGGKGSKKWGNNNHYSWSGLDSMMAMIAGYGPWGMKGQNMWGGKGDTWKGKGGWSWDGPYGMMGKGKGWGMDPWATETQSEAYDKISTIGPPKLHWLPCPDNLVQAAFSKEGPAIAYDKKNALFGSAWSILKEVLGEEADTLFEIEHDEEWTQMPELGEAMKIASGEENGIAIATCAKHGKWGAGFYQGKKGRENAARLALAVAIAKDTELEVSLRQKFTEFAVLLDGGLNLSNIPRGVLGTGDSTFPTVHGINIPETSALVQRGLSSSALGMQFDKAQKEFFSSGPHILGELMGHGYVEVHDDPEWKNFPEVGKFLHGAGLEKDCYALAIAPCFGIWAVGVGTGWKGRDHAARLALSVAVAAAGAAPTLTTVLTEYPEFATILQTAGLIN